MSRPTAGCPESRPGTAAASNKDPSAAIAALPAYLRHRETLVQTAAMRIQRMQKALVQINRQLHVVISDITGVTGMKILRDIVAGRTDPHELARHRDQRCSASEVEIAAALTGHYRPEHVFVLKQNLELFDAYQRQLVACDAAMTLAPYNKVSGGRLLSSRTQPSANRAAALLRLAAMSLGRTQTALGAFYRRLAYRVGKAKAITATARKLAMLVYRALKGTLLYQDPGAAAYDSTRESASSSWCGRHLRTAMMTAVSGGDRCHGPRGSFSQP